MLSISACENLKRPVQVADRGIELCAWLRGGAVEAREDLSRIPGGDLIHDFPGSGQVTAPCQEQNLGHVEVGVTGEHLAQPVQGVGRAREIATLQCREEQVVQDRR